MFAYDVMTEQEAMQERYQLLKEGIYDAVITSSNDTSSKSSGAPMMDMTVSVFDENGKKHDIRDFLVFTPKMMWKVVHFSDSAGILKEYEEGKLCSDIAIDRRVKVKITIEEGQEIPFDKLKNSPMGAKYPDKNKIEDYVKRSDQKQTDKGNTNFNDDDIDF